MLYTYECEECGAENTLEGEPTAYLEKEATCSKYNTTQIVCGYTDIDLSEISDCQM